MIQIERMGDGTLYEISLEGGALLTYTQKWPAVVHALEHYFNPEGKHGDLWRGNPVTLACPLCCTTWDRKPSRKLFKKDTPYDE